MEKKEFISKIESKEARVLTLDIAKNLKGKSIYWMYFGYNENTVGLMTVGDVISKFDLAKTKEDEKYPSQAAYWESYMSKKKLDEVKRTLCLLDSEGKETFIYCDPDCPLYDEPTFHCSDIDREVYFIEK